ncbi:asparagine synthase-related protein, partial [Rahnella aceris]
QYSGWSPRGASFLESVISCEPGTITNFNYSNYSTILLNLPEKKAIPKDLLSAASVIKKNLQTAVGEHIPSNKRIGIAVSGGIDSVYMTSLVKKTLGERSLLTFSYGYDTDDPNVVGGKQISDLLNCEHTSVITYPDEVPQLLTESIAHLEEPVGRDQYLMLTKMAKVARGKVDTLITGNCGDAVFGSPPLAKY